MGNWFQNAVIKAVSEEEIEAVSTKIIEYLIAEEIISRKMSNNVLSSDNGYKPGNKWQRIVEYPEENDFLTLRTNGMDITKGRNVFFAGGADLEVISCPNCNENNIDCDWGELFGSWIDEPSTAILQCRECREAFSISEYIFEPTWALSNLGFTFWNWPILKDAFISKLQDVVGKPIIRVDGKL